MYEEWSILLNGKICKYLSRCIWLGSQLQPLSSREGEFKGNVRSGCFRSSPWVHALKAE